MAITKWYSPDRRSTYYSTTGTTAVSYDDIDRYRDELMSKEDYDNRYAKRSQCVSCGLTHGASQIYEEGKCEITMVKELEAKEAMEKKHNENIRKLYWERYSTSHNK